MDKKDRLRLMLSKLRQQRHYLEKSCERAGKLLPVSIILRWRKKGTRDFQPIKKEGKEVSTNSGSLEISSNGFLMPLQTLHQSAENSTIIFLLPSKALLY